MEPPAGDHRRHRINRAEGQILSGNERRKNAWLPEPKRSLSLMNVPRPLYIERETRIRAPPFRANKIQRRSCLPVWCAREHLYVVTGYGAGNFFIGSSIKLPWSCPADREAVVARASVAAQLGALKLVMENHWLGLRLQGVGSQVYCVELGARSWFFLRFIEFNLQYNTPVQTLYSSTIKKRFNTLYYAVPICFVSNGINQMYFRGMAVFILLPSSVPNHFWRPQIKFHVINLIDSL